VGAWGVGGGVGGGGGLWGGGGGGPSKTMFFDRSTSYRRRDTKRRKEKGVVALHPKHGTQGGKKMSTQQSLDMTRRQITGSKTKNGDKEKKKRGKKIREGYIVDAPWERGPETKSGYGGRGKSV